MVIPLSRSAGRKSVVVLPVSTEPEEDRYEDFKRTDSVNVVFPESVRLGQVLSWQCENDATHLCAQPAPYSVSLRYHHGLQFRYICILWPGFCAET